MYRAVTRGGSLTPYMVASFQNIPSVPRSITLEFPKIQEKEVLTKLPKAEPQTNFSLSRSLLKGPIAASHSVGVNAVRCAHTDVKFADFSYYKKKADQVARSAEESSDIQRKTFSYVILGGGVVAGAFAAKGLVQELVSTMSATADVLALAQTEVNLADIPEGRSMTFKWRGKPLFVKHRTAEEIEKEATVDLSTLREPEHDKDRVKKPEYLVVIGICTHLGCVPVADAGDYGGYYCPCHGSHYDGSGRIRKGPAPLNLEVPEYIIKDESTLVVG